MEKILLVEPGYKNKYPPIGLMKISNFHKEYRKDYVKFVKGIEELEIKKWNRIYITTLFTFDFDMVVKTINYYKSYVENPEKDIIIGGILASLLSEKLELAVGIKPFKGQVTSASMIGYNELQHVNVDIEPLDYDILSEIDYEYDVADSYIGYTSRGCPNKCKFCAVPTLEPEFNTTNNITRQVKAISEKYGEKRNLMLMDNNILYSPYLADIIEELKELGFSKNERTFKKPNYPKEILKRIMRKEKISRLAYKKDIEKDIVLLLEEIKKIKVKKNAEEKLAFFKQNLERKQCLYLKLEYIKWNIQSLDFFYENGIRQIKLVRYIDFNQGTDARLLTNEKMEYLSQIYIKPYRIAFDNIKLKEIYLKAMKIAARYGVKHFSNYILFNYEDAPKEFWERLKLNIDLAEEIEASDLFSFPMKYVPIENTDRKFIGDKWKKKYIQNTYGILNAKKGIVPKGRDYFENAFGSTPKEFEELLRYPKDLIIYRNFFKELGITDRWLALFRSLTEKENENLLRYQNGENIKASSIKLNELFLLESIKEYKVKLVIEHKFKNHLDSEELYRIMLDIESKKFNKKKEIINYLKQS